MKRIKKRKKAGLGNKTESKGPFFPSVQTKLTVGKADDAFEKEADQVADKVTGKSGEQSSIQKMESKEEEPVQQKPFAEISSIQKKGAPEEEKEAPAQKKEKEEEPIQKQGVDEEEAVQQKQEAEEEPVQKQEEEEAAQPKGEEEEEAAQTKGEEEEEAAQPKEEEEVQEKSMGHAQSRSIESRLKKSKGKGQMMDAKTKAEMEHGFGADFSDVKIHTDSEAERMSRDMGAQAFTHGKDIYFNEGKFDPNSRSGKHLLAHELTHTIQQGHRKQKVQRKKGNQSLMSRMKELKDIALNDSQNFTPALRSEFVSGLNTIFQGMEVNHFGHANVQEMPAKMQPKSIYFTLDSTYHKGNPAVTKSGAVMPGNWFIPNRSIPGQQNEAVIFLGPNCIQDTMSYTQSVLEHEAVHVDQNYNNTRDAKASNDEVIAYSEQFSRIYSFSEGEIYGHLVNWLKAYAPADESFQKKAVERTIYHLMYRFDRMLAQFVMNEIDPVKKWIEDRLPEARKEAAREALSYVEYTLNELSNRK